MLVLFRFSKKVLFKTNNNCPTLIVEIFFCSFLRKILVFLIVFYLSSCENPFKLHNLLKNKNSGTSQLLAIVSFKTYPVGPRSTTRTAWRTPWWWRRRSVPGLWRPPMITSISGFFVYINTQLNEYLCKKYFL